MLIGLVVNLLVLSSILWAADYSNDSDIAKAIERRLSFDQGINSSNVVVETKEGIAILSGSVDNILASERAIEIAQTIKGVRSVIDMININPVKREDEEIRSDILYAIKLDPIIESLNIDAKVTDGMITLTGTVDSFVQKIMVEKVVKGVKGIKSVDNKIAIIEKLKRSDDEIKADIESRLKGDVLLDSHFINVDVSDGNVKLSGVVGSLRERLRAGYNTQVTGIKSLNTANLEVDLSKRNEMRRMESSIKQSDPDIKKSIEDTLIYDPRVNLYDVKVEVVDHVVTLTGTVDNLNSSQATQNDAINTFGVWSVRNQITVKSELIDDSKLLDNISKALMRDPYLANFDMKIGLLHGKVNLNGAVSSYFNKRRAEYVVSNIKGVVSVQNNLMVKTQEKNTDSIIKENIENIVSWNSYINSDSIKVAVEDSVATLTGSVDNLYESRIAEEIALDGGAKDIINKLEIKHSSDK